MSTPATPRKVFRRRNVGIDRDNDIVGKDEAEVLERALEHAQAVHAVHEVVGTPHDLIGRARQVIKDG